MPAKPAVPKHSTPERQGGGSGSERRGSVAAAQPLADREAWQAEYERVKDKLVVSVHADTAASREWRPQLEHAIASLSNLQAAAAPAQEAIQGSGQRLATTADALAVSSKSAVGKLAGLQAEHRTAGAAVAALQAEQAARQEYVAGLEQELQFLNKELEERQRDMAQQGSSMSDKRPVARLADACTSLRAELLQMEVRTGVLQAMLLRQATVATKA